MDKGEREKKKNKWFVLFFNVEGSTVNSLEKESVLDCFFLLCRGMKFCIERKIFSEQNSWNIFAYEKYDDANFYLVWNEKRIE